MLKVLKTILEGSIITFKVIAVAFMICGWCGIGILLILNGHIKLGCLFLAIQGVIYLWAVGYIAK